MAVFFSQKQTEEEFFVSFDFTDVLGTETIESATVKVIDQSTGLDVTDSLTDVVKQYRDYKVVYVWVRGGVSGRSYVLTCEAFCTEDSEYVLDGILPVFDPVHRVFRASPSEVRAIMDTMTLTDPVIESFIAGANALVNAVFGSSTADTTKEIERWLAAHMIASTVERMAANEGAGGASIKYTGEWKQNLSSTPYGQMVMMLDTTGALLAASLGKMQASVFAVPSFE